MPVGIRRDLFMFNKSDKLVMIFDGSYFCYRSYYGYPELYLTDRVTHVGLIYGFLCQLKSYYRRYQPKKMIIAWDSKDNIRKKMYSGYKSKGRDNPNFDPAAFHQQLGVLKVLLHDMGIAQISQVGYEADDVMAEFCARAKRKNDKLRFMIVTSDHDLYQTIDERVSVLKPLKEGSKLYNERTFHQEFGITPNQYLQSMYLSGCKTDTVPSIEGIGEKTAINIIKAVGDISNLQNVEKIKGIGDKRLAVIKSSQKEIEFAKSLVTVFKDFRINVQKGEKNLAVVRHLFEHYLRFDSFIYEWEDFEEMCS